MLNVKSMSPAFKWTLSIVLFLGLIAFTADKVGFTDRLISPQVETKAGEEAFTDSIIKRLFEKFDNAIPRLFPETQDLDRAIKSYRSAKTQAERTERAYDLIALKSRLEVRGSTVTPEQQLAYDRALQQIQWAAQVAEYYSKKIPESSIGNIDLKFGSRLESIPSDKAKKLLAASFSSTKGECSEAQMQSLRQNHDEEWLAMNLPGLMRILLLMQIDIDRKVATALKMPLLNSVPDENHRQVIESVYKIRDASAEANKPEEESRKTILMDFFDGKNKDLGFTIYAAAPGCFQGKNVVAFVAMIHRLTTDLRAKYLLDVIRDGYRTKKVLPTEIESLRMENPVSEREKFYRRPSDGWGRTLELKIENNYVTLKSSGIDREMGTADDFIAAEGALDEAL